MTLTYQKNPLVFLFFILNTLVYGQKTEIIQFSNGESCEVQFLDPIFDTNKEFINVSSEEFANISDVIDVYCDCRGSVSDNPCPFFFDPVCGCDDNLYSNACFALNAGIKEFYSNYEEDGNGGCTINKDDPVGVIGGNRRRKKTKGYKVKPHDDFYPSPPGGCYVYQAWEWIITDYDEETLTVLDEITVTRKFRIDDSSKPEIRLLPNLPDPIPIAIMMDNGIIIDTMLNRINTRSFYYWFGRDGCLNSQWTLLSKVNTLKKDWYADFDGDGYGDKNTVINWGTKPPRYVNNDLDDDDSIALINPSIPNVNFHNEDGIPLSSDFIMDTNTNSIVSIKPNSVDNSGQKLIKEQSIPDLKIYPNPISTAQEIQLEIYLPTSENISINLYNALGIAVKNITSLNSAGKHNLSIGTDDLTKGIYFLTLKHRNGQITKKVLLVD